MRRTAESPEDGFTLIELLVTMTLLGVVLAIAVAPYKNYQRAQAHQNAARLVVASLRNAQVSAVAENATYRVTFGAAGTTWQAARLNSGGTWTNVGAPGRSGDTEVFVRDASFRQNDGSLGTTVYFYPRGSATKGSLVVARTGRDKVYTVSVEGLTARVSYS